MVVCRHTDTKILPFSTSKFCLYFSGHNRITSTSLPKTYKVPKTQKACETTFPAFSDAVTGMCYS